MWLWLWRHRRNVALLAERFSSTRRHVPVFAPSIYNENDVGELLVIANLAQIHASSKISFPTSDLIHIRSVLSSPVVLFGFVALYRWLFLSGIGLKYRAVSYHRTIAPLMIELVSTSAINHLN